MTREFATLGLVLFLVGTAGCREESQYRRSLAAKEAVPADRPGETVSAPNTTPLRLQEQSFEGTVIRVVDGDSLVVLDEGRRMIRIRLSGADAPERHQPFGSVARQHLGEILYSRVTVEPRKIDRYGRTIAVVRRDGVDLGLQMIEEGLAWHYKFYESEQPPEERQAYARAQSTASEAGEGLWRDPTPMPPWDFRGSGSQAERPSSDLIWDGHVIANRASGVYHLPGCAGYSRVGARNRIRYESEAAAQAAGYRRAAEC